MNTILGGTMKHIPTLDGWRAIAIIAVIVHHIAMFYGNDSWWAGRGAMGVDIFFAVSGLLITTQLLQPGTSMKSFYIRRAFRILPPAICFLGILFAFHLINGRDVLQCLFIIRNYVEAGSTYTTHFWSLSLEEQFYFLWPVVLLCLAKRRAPLLVFIAILAVSVCRGFASIVLYSHAVRGIGMNQYFHTDMRCDGLLWGCLAAFCLTKTDLKCGKVITVLCLVGAFFLWGNPLFMPLSPILLTGVVLGTVQQPAWRLSRMLEWKPLTWIGQRSYGIYLWQSLFIFTPLPVPMALKIAAVLAWSAVLYEYVESPLRRIGKGIALQVADTSGFRSPLGGVLEEF
jgi:peptidoglycan/LPS O-acetylase OafA/YrhL